MPLAAPRPCVKHPDILLNIRERCPKCPKPKKPTGWKPDKERGNRHKRGYGTEWEKIRKKVLEKALYKCAVCMAKRATHVDHIIPKSQNGTNKINNLQAICIECHKKKTATEANRKKQEKN